MIVDSSSSGHYDSSVTVVEHFKFLGTTITNTLKWDNNIPQIVKKGQQRLFSSAA